ncbi:hypothetical protein C0Q70_16373 [Pomacea canaliculata]|uniref:Uncharacterized protein n=1 Tax=Pomacea canaliculata TaxID=400727 RepID=A0A2T7NPL1_POMCA|nr:hypothetical protein C0Q70_16373 [Pomacea canaliculata]
MAEEEKREREELKGVEFTWVEKKCNTRVEKDGHTHLEAHGCVQTSREDPSRLTISGWMLFVGTYTPSV